ncbi:hypothetical protein C8R46DRAFT_394452 [Mycena filopes]|nr:hypothetical protein C8R46DRAFT_394452 [Mycena filopes]
MDDVPDSDGEEYLSPAQQAPPTPAPAPPTDAISYFASAKPMVDSISSSSSGAPPIRPRPRPVFKGAAARLAASTESSMIVDMFSDQSNNNLSLSDRVKTRKRGTQQASTSESNIIEIDDSEDELAISETKPKPRQRTQSKSSAAAGSSSSNPRMPSPNQPAPKTAPFPFSASPLPPSDPFPHSTAATRPDAEDFVPPIATLSAAGDTSFDPASSPSAKKERPKPRPKVMLKLKPPKPPSVELLGGLPGDHGAGLMLPPQVPRLAPLLPPIAGPSAEPDVGAVPARDKPPKKLRKKEAGEAGEKPAKKPRAKKAKKDAGAEGEQEIPKATGEGEDGHQEKPKKKKKAAKGKEKEKEVFKSAEFIADDDDEPLPPVDAPLPLPLHSSMDIDPPAAGPWGGKPVSVISIPDSQPDEELAPVVGEKRKRVGEDDDDAAYGDAPIKDKGKGKVVSAERKSKKAKTVADGADKPKKKATAKKAKGTVIMSDEEDDAVGFDKGKKKGTTKKAKGTVVMSDDEDDTVGADAMLMDVDSSIPPPPPESEGDEPVVKPAKKKKTKKAVVPDSDGEGGDACKPNENSPPRPSSKSQVENNASNSKVPPSPKKKNAEETPKPASSIGPKYSISRTKSTPMAELIRRVSSQPGSPFPPVMQRSRSSLGGGSASGTPTTTYSPYNKFSRSALSRIAPLHPNRRTPPPPLPPPPPKPKTKKEKEREDRWTEEMHEAVGGWDAWKLLSDEEQKAAKRAKWARELEGWDE